VDVARLPPSEPASHEAMRLLCLITQDCYGVYNRDLSGGKHERSAGSGAGSDKSPGSVVRGVAAGLGAASVGLAHLKGFRRSHAPLSRHDAPRLSRGIIAGFVCWVCDAPGVFPELQERGLLKVLGNLLRSTEGNDRREVGVAVATLIFQHDAARAPLRALGAIPPLTEQLKVRSGLCCLCNCRRKSPCN
jgi:hypothetical protein